MAGAAVVGLEVVKSVPKGRDASKMELMAFGNGYNEETIKRSGSKVTST